MKMHRTFDDAFERLKEISRMGAKAAHRQMKIKPGTTRIQAMRLAMDRLADVECLLAYSCSADLGVPDELIGARQMSLAALKALKEVDNQYADR